MVDNRQSLFPKDIYIIQRLCNRKYGIGSDGLILIEPHDTVDFIMDFYNPDGSQSFCGNGSRCAAMFAYELGMTGTSGRFEAIDGMHHFTIGEDEVRISMRDVKEVEQKGLDFFVNTGSPHYIHMIDENIHTFNIVTYGSEIRYSDEFRHINGTNVNAVHALDDQSIEIATYERGVEGETLSCGTGVTACALAFGQMKNINRVNVRTKGGDLAVSFDRTADGFHNIQLTGPAKKVFQGHIDL